MKKYVLTIVGITILLVFVVGSLVYYGQLKKSVLVKPDSSINTDTVPSLASNIIKSGKIEDCKQLDGKVVGGVDYQTVCKNNIAQNIAQTNLDVKACDGLDNKLMSISDCQSSVIAGLIGKEKSLTVCDQFTDTLKASCVNNYWSIAAIEKKDPSLCVNIASSSPQAIIDCQSSVLISSVSNGKSIPNCSLFSGTIKTDCTNYTKNNCQALTFPPLQQICQTKTK